MASQEGFDGPSADSNENLSDSDSSSGPSNSSRRFNSRGSFIDPILDYLEMIEFFVNSSTNISPDRLYQEDILNPQISYLENLYMQYLVTSIIDYEAFFELFEIFLQTVDLFFRIGEYRTRSPTLTEIVEVFFEDDLDFDFD